MGISGSSLFWCCPAFPVMRHCFNLFRIFLIRLKWSDIVKFMFIFSSQQTGPDVFGKDVREKHVPLFPWRVRGKRSGGTDQAAPKKRGWETSGAEKGGSWGGWHGWARWKLMRREDMGQGVQAGSSGPGGVGVLGASLVCYRKAWMQHGGLEVLLLVVEKQPSAKEVLFSTWYFT